MPQFLEALSPVIAVFSMIILGLGLIQNIVYILQLPAAWLELRLHSQADDTESGWQLLISDIPLPISLLVPAYNESAVIVHSVRAMLAMEYTESEVIVINDGSTDDTLQVLIDTFGLQPVQRAYELSVLHAPIRGLYGSPLYPRLLVIDKENGRGKADAMNAGLNLSRTPLFCIIDADSILEESALLRAVRPFVEDPLRMVAVGGTIRIANGCEVHAGRIVRVGLPRRFLPMVQTLEYVRAFLMARMAWSHWRVLTIISGAFGIFRRPVAVEVGGFSHNTVGEDLEMVMKIHRLLHDQAKEYRMRYVPEPVCWTEAPESWAMLGNQRRRWQRGSLETFFKHKRMLLNPRYGRIGMLGMPYSLIVDVLGPICELLGYVLIPLFWYVGFLNTPFLLAYTALVFMFGVFISTASLILEEMELRRFPRARDLLIVACVAVVENFGYRQINNFWRLQGWWQYLRKQQGWGAMTRTGFQAKKE